MARKERICTEVSLPADAACTAAACAVDTWPVNAPMMLPGLTVNRIAVLTTKFWGKRASDLTIGFMEQTTAAMRDKVLAYANRWGEFSSVRFRWTKTDPVIRISFGPGGYYSYLGTDALQIPKNQHTMNLEGFTVNTPEREWKRVVTHEFGHSLGCPHEQQRKEILDLLDYAKTVAYFRQTQGWSEKEVRQQILVPLEERSLMAGSSPVADQTSIMCYQFPGSITKTGKPIPGGMDFSAMDREFFGKIYPPDVTTPAPPVADGRIVTLVGLDSSGKEVSRFALR